MRDGTKVLMQKWEQIAVKTESRKELDATLRQYSADGWELVGVTTMQGTAKKEYGGHLGCYDAPWFQWDLFFKRPTQEQPLSAEQQKEYSQSVQYGKGKTEDDD